MSIFTWKPKKNAGLPIKTSPGDGPTGPSVPTELMFGCWRVARALPPGGPGWAIHGPKDGKIPFGFFGILWPWKVWLVKFTGNPDYPLLNDYDHPQVYIYILGSLLSYRPGFWTLRTTAWWSPKSCIWDHQNLTESSAWISKKNGLWYSPRPWVYPLVIKHGLLERPLLTSMIFPAINHDLSGISQLATLDYRKLNGLELPWWIVKCHSMPIYTTLNPTKPH